MMFENGTPGDFKSKPHNQFTHKLTKIHLASTNKHFCLEFEIILILKVNSLNECFEKICIFNIESTIKCMKTSLANYNRFTNSSGPKNAYLAKYPTCGFVNIPSFPLPTGFTIDPEVMHHDCFLVRLGIGGLDLSDEINQSEYCIL